MNELDGFLMQDLDDMICRLRDNRQSNRESQASLARRAGILQSMVCEWELGVTSPTARSLFTWAGALGFDLALIPREPPELAGAGVVRRGTQQPVPKEET